MSATATCGICGVEFSVDWPAKRPKPHPFWRSDKVQTVCLDCAGDLRSMTPMVDRLILRRGRKRVFNLVGRHAP